MKRITLILALIFVSYLSQAQSKEYMVLEVYERPTGFSVEYFENNEKIELDFKRKEEHQKINETLNSLAKKGWEVKTVGGSGSSSTGTTFHYVLERERK